MTTTRDREPEISLSAAISAVALKPTQLSRARMVAQAAAANASGV